MDIFITGAAGFLGSHVLLHWLVQRPMSRALCLVRSSRENSALNRVKSSLAQSIFECSLQIDIDKLMNRITIIDSDLEQLQLFNMPSVSSWFNETLGFQVIHCAANLSFREANRQQVWNINVTGTTILLKALRDIPKLIAFNYVSTAYVAGTKEGHIFEDRMEQPSLFNNVYEESKWNAEQIVINETEKMSIGMRIFRPSIIVGHSTTLRISVETGLYKVLGTLVQCAHSRLAPRNPIQIPVKRNANLNLMPIDLVVQEMFDVINAGIPSLGKIFHLTNERPLSVADIFYGVASLTGVCLCCRTNQSQKKDIPKEEVMILKCLQDYLPYFSQARTFDRSNVHLCGANRYQQQYWLDIVTLRQLVSAYMEAKTANLYNSKDAIGV